MKVSILKNTGNPQGDLVLAGVYEIGRAHV